MDSIRAENPNTLFLNAGDYYQGTMWFYLMKGAIIADTIELLRHDAMVSSIEVAEAYSKME